MKKNKTIVTLIAILSIMCVAITAGFIYLLVNRKGFNFSLDFSAKSMNLIESYENVPSNIENIILNLYSTDVEIKASTNEKILVEYYSNRDNNPKIDHDDTLIKVDESAYDVSCFGICNTMRKVVLYIPNEYYGEYSITTKSGDIFSKIEDLNNKIAISTMSGDVNLNSAKDANISTMSGDVNISSAKDVNISTMSGDVNISSVQDATASTSSGDIKISEINKISNLKTTSGDIRIGKLNVKENSKIQTTSGDVEIDNNESKCYVETKTTSGDEHINNSDRKSDIVLNIKTTSGDIKVN